MKYKLLTLIFILFSTARIYADPYISCSIKGDTNACYNGVNCFRIVCLDIYGIRTKKEAKIECLRNGYDGARWIGNEKGGALGNDYNFIHDNIYDCSRRCQYSESKNKYYICKNSP